MTTNYRPNVIVGAGRLFIDVLDANGKRQGERYMGSSPGFTINAVTEEVSVYDDDGPIGALLDQVVTTLSRTFSATIKDVSMDNLALFIIGDKDEQIDAADNVVDELLTVKQGLWYQLGVSAGKPAGVRSIATAGLTVSNKAGDSDFATPADYVVDAPNGRIQIVSGGAIVDGAEIKVDYTPVAAKIERVTGGTLKKVLCALRYIEDPVAGKGRNYYAPFSSVRPSGASQIKTEGRRSPQTMQFEFAINKPTDGGKDLVIIPQA